MALKMLYQTINRLSTQDLLIQKMRFTLQIRFLTSLKRIFYGSAGLMAGNLLKVLSDGMHLSVFDAISMPLVAYLIIGILALENLTARDVAGHELIGDLLELRGLNRRSS